MFAERRQLWKVSWSAQPLPVNIPCSDNWKYHWLRIVATCICLKIKVQIIKQIINATPSSLGWRVLSWYKTLAEIHSGQDEQGGDFGRFSGIPGNRQKHPLLSASLLAASPYPQYIIIHSRVADYEFVYTILCLILYFWPLPPRCCLILHR